VERQVLGADRDKDTKVDAEDHAGALNGRAVVQHDVIVDEGQVVRRHAGAAPVQDQIVGVDAEEGGDARHESARDRVEGGDVDGLAFGQPVAAAGNPGEPVAFGDLD